LSPARGHEQTGLRPVLIRKQDPASPLKDKPLLALCLSMTLENVTPSIARDTSIPICPDGSHSFSLDEGNNTASAHQ
jgi:hypothetical protein